MPNQDDFPAVWSCESDDKKVRVEVRVPNAPGLLPETIQDDVDEVAGEYSWIEIPTTSVEQWVEKGDAAAIQRTAKVRFPTEWGRDTASTIHNSPRRLIESFSAARREPFMLARVWWQDRHGEWILNHLGWIGGVGASADEGVSKMWIYDFAELLAGVPYGATLNDLTLKQAAEHVAKATNNETPIPVSNVVIVPPDSEEEFAIATSDDDGSDVSLLGRDIAPGAQTAFGVDESMLGTPYFSLDTGDIGVSLDSPQQPKESDESFVARTLGAEFSEEEDTGEETFDSGREFQSTTVQERGEEIPETEAEATARGPVENDKMGKKSFVANHDTMLDLYDWFEGKSDAKLHFQPRAESVLLVADVVPERRIFTDYAVVQQEINNGNFDYLFHEKVAVLNNDALYEMKPINTLHLRGSTDDSFRDAVEDFIGGIEIDAASQGSAFSFNPPAEKYPVAKAQVPALVEAAEGVELAPELVESDASTLAEAEREAKRRLARHLEEAGEGHIEIAGVPRMMPYDGLDSFEVCGEHVEFEQTPVRYEIESVKHVKKGGEPYKTEVQVSVWANDTNIVVESHEEDVAGNRV